MSCNDEITSIEQVAPGAQNGSAGGGAGEETNLYEFIDRDKVWGLNLAPPESARNVVKPWDARNSMEEWTESNVDDQFILTVPFTCPVRIKSIILNPGRGDFAPQRCTAFVNRPDGIDFEEADAAASAMSGAGGVSRGATLGPVGSGKPQADFALLEGQSGATEYPVSVARFANTNSVSLVLSDAPARELSRLYYLGFKGVALQLKKDENQNLNVPAANAADSVVHGVREDRRAAQSGGSVR